MRRLGEDQISGYLKRKAIDDVSEIINSGLGHTHRSDMYEDVFWFWSDKEKAQQSCRVADIYFSEGFVSIYLAASKNILTPGEEWEYVFTVSLDKCPIIKKHIESLIVLSDMI